MKKLWDLGKMAAGAGGPPCICEGNAPLRHPWMRREGPKHWGWGKQECCPQEPHPLQPVSTAACHRSLISRNDSRGDLIEQATKDVILFFETLEDLSFSLNFINMTSDPVTQHTLLTASKNIRSKYLQKSHSQYNLHSSWSLTSLHSVQGGCFPNAVPSSTPALISLNEGIPCRILATGDRPTTSWLCF